MDEGQKPDKPDGDRDRRVANLTLLVLAAVVVGIGVWLIVALDDARKADNCLSQGRRNCNPIETPPR